jgi:urea transport system permease protein
LTRDRLRLALRSADKGLTPGLFTLLLAGVPAMYALGVVDIVTVNQLGRFICLAIVAVGVDLVWGYTGMLSLCQAMFFCFGGYCMGMHLAMHGPLDGEGIPRALFVVTSEVSGFQLPWFWKPFGPLPLALLLGMAIPAVAAGLFGYFAFRSRVRGVYFSIITQALTLAAVLVFRRNETRLCGTNGLTNFVTIAGFDLSKPSTRIGLYLLSAMTLLLTYHLSRRLVSSRLGRLMVAVRDSESRLRFTGHDPVRVKLFAFVVGAVLAGIGGMLYVPQNGIITPFKMEPAESILAVIWVAVGGRGTLRGAILGALLVNYLASVTTSAYPLIWPFLLGGLFVTVVKVLPEGIIGTWESFVRVTGENKPIEVSTSSSETSTLPASVAKGES